MTFSTSSKARLTEHDLGRFDAHTLFHRLGRAVCVAGCLPRKELHEAWQMARRVRRRFRGHRIVDMGGGHGLLAHVMLLLDDSSPHAVVVDTHIPSSSLGLHRALVQSWPRLSDRLHFVSEGMETFAIDKDDLVLSSHACGRLTDLVLDRAVSARARVAVLPCCHDFETCDAGVLAGWVDKAMAIDIMRAVRLEAKGYRAWTATISQDVTPKNRLLIAEPSTALISARVDLDNLSPRA